MVKEGVKCDFRLNDTPENEIMADENEKSLPVMAEILCNGPIKEYEGILSDVWRWQHRGS